MAPSTPPIGAQVPDWTPRKPPARTMLQGRAVRLQPLDAARHGPALWDQVRGADALWTYMAYGPFESRDAFVAWLHSRETLDDPLTFAAIEPMSGAVTGLFSLMEIRPAMGVIEVGHILLSPALQRQTAATEAIAMLARHVFDDLGYRRFEWKCNALNEPSRRAALRYGFLFEGVFRNHQIVKGRNRDTAWFAMTDTDWPARRAAFDAWLSPDNFDPAGQQRRSLTTLMPDPDPLSL